MKNLSDKYRDLEDEHKEITNSSKDQLEKLTEENKIALKQVQEMNLQISQSSMIFDKIVERLRLFLMHVYGPKFDEAYLAIRDVDPSPKSKQAMTLPLIELTMFTFLQNV